LLVTHAFTVRALLGVLPIQERRLVLKPGSASPAGAICRLIAGSRRESDESTSASRGDRRRVPRSGDVDHMVRSVVRITPNRSDWVVTR